MKLHKMFTAVLAVGMLWSCQTDDNSENNPENVESSTTVSKNFNGTSIEVIPMGNGVYRNGDMLFRESQFLPKNASTKIPAPDDDTKLAVGGGVQKWTDNTVAYVIDPSLSSTVQSELAKSFEEWSTRTNVQFKERTNESNFVTIAPAAGFIPEFADCNCGVANLGMNGDQGFILLGAATTEPVITHEIGHTLGFIHEQNRADRDQFINVNFENIQPQGRDQYFVDRFSTPLTDQVDFNSIMMYRSSTFSIDPTSGNFPTMTRRDTGAPVQGLGDNLTDQDIVGTNNLYPAIADNGADCTGVAEYNPNVRYRNGDKVTFQGDLYEAINFRFVNQGPCRN